MKKVVLNKCYGGYGLSKEAYEFLGIPWDGYGYAYSDDRDNPQLIACVEKLGVKASGPFAELTVEEYDDYNYTYYISEYDGFEGLEMTPVVHKSKLIKLSVNEIVKYLTSLHITVVD